MADTNLTLVQETYGAFGRGDIPAVLGAFTADIEWNVPAVLPHGAKARGPEEVGSFFEVLASTWENFDLRLDDFVASGDRVCAFGSAHGTLELYPNVVDGLEEEGGVPSRLTKTEAGDGRQEGTPCMMFARSPSGRATRPRSRWTTSRVRVLAG